MSSNKLNHIGFIADGNRRWAKSHNLPTLEGHRRGADKVEMIIEFLAKTDVRFVSFFVFSTDNWNRSAEEVSYLMEMLGKNIEKFTKKAMQENIRVVILGRPEKVDPELWERLQENTQKTDSNTGLTACFCFNYGGWWEIADAARQAAAAGEKDYTPESFRKYLYHPEIPDVDLVVRTSGENRSSGFMLWRAALAEYYFMDKYFPDLESTDLEQIMEIYAGRERRFGK